MFIVMCKVSGGYTGTRIAELKENSSRQLVDPRDVRRPA